MEIVKARDVVEIAKVRDAVKLRTVDLLWKV